MYKCSNSSTLRGTVSCSHRSAFRWRYECWFFSTSRLDGCTSLRSPLSSLSDEMVGRSSTGNIAMANTAVPDVVDGGNSLQHVLLNRVFSIYRRLFSLVFLGNLTALLAVVVRRNPENWPQISDLATAVSTNLVVCVLVRLEHVVNLIFTVFCSLPKSAPFVVRKWAANVYHVGGLHSGCAFAALIWFIVLSAAVTREFAVGSQVKVIRDPAVLVITYFILVLLLGIILSALSKFRARFHNSFEVIHRFGGWTLLTFLWVYVILLSGASKTTEPEASLGHAIVTSPPFWHLIIATCSVVYPWLRLRMVQVDAEVLSDHAVRLRFGYTTPKIGFAIRLSDNPLKEWHAFAAISVPGTSGCSVVVSNAGDWTKRLIENPPSKIWVRGIPAAGVLRASTLFRKIVLVATGSGIGPCLQAIYSKQVECRILWSTPHPLETFGQKILDAVTEKDPEAHIHNSRTLGRPDMVALTYRLYLESQAEAVIVISNPRLTKEVVRGMEARGVPAYGPIWDS